MALLEGIKVIDFSKWLPGQYCGMLLGDYGADVVKIEDLQGDATRRFWPEKTKGMSYWHLMLNRNKRGVALNLKKDGGRCFSGGLPSGISGALWTGLCKRAQNQSASGVLLDYRLRPGIA